MIKKRILMITMVSIIILAISTFLSISCRDTVSVEGITEEEAMDEEMMEGYMDVTPEEAKTLIDENPDLVIIDVSPAYADGHLPGAVNYPVGDGSLDEAIPDLDQEATYLVYCHTMEASVLGAQKLVDAGFMNVYRLLGEYSAWVDAGYEIKM